MHKPRLRRLQFLHTPYPVYFITACTRDRAGLLAAPEIHLSFIDFARRAIERHVAVGRYVLMPDHLHLFAAFAPESPSLSLWMKSLKNGLSKTWRQWAVPAPHWQDGFFDHILRSSESYDAKWDYVRDNPVRAGLVKRWQHWPFQGEIQPLAVADNLP